MKRGERSTDGLLMEALLHTLRGLTPLARGLCVILLAVYLASGLRFVEPHQTALVLRLGKLQTAVHEPGLLWVWPAPIDEVVVLDTGSEHSLILDTWTPGGPRVERGRGTRPVTEVEVAAALASTGNLPLPEEYVPAGDWLDPVTDGYTLTGDWNVVQGQFTLRYRITDPVAYFRGGPSVPRLLHDLALQAATHALAELPIDRGLTDGQQALAQACREHLAALLSERAVGIEPTAFEIRHLTPPTQVAPAFEDVTSAKLFARTLQENAQEYRQGQITKARGQADAIKRRAEAFAAESLAASQGEAAAFVAFLAEYQRAPQLVRGRIYQESIDYVMQHVHSTTVVREGEAPPSVFLEPSSASIR